MMGEPKMPTAEEIKKTTQEGVEQEKELDFEADVEKLKAEADSKGLTLEVSVEASKNNHDPKSQLERWQKDILVAVRKMLDMNFPFDQKGGAVTVQYATLGAGSSWAVLRTHGASIGEGTLYQFKNGQLEKL